MAKYDHGGGCLCWFYGESQPDCEYCKNKAAAPLVVDTKATNPKDAIGNDKLPVHLWPGVATAHGCLGLLDGMLKYGRTNWRDAGVRSTIYVDAAKRHLEAWLEGENADPDSGVHHLGHVLACCAIVLDAEAAGKLNDDRNFTGGYRKAITDLTPHVARLKKLHAGRSPRHYTIKDAAEKPAPAPKPPRKITETTVISASPTASIGGKVLPWE